MVANFLKERHIYKVIQGYCICPLLFIQLSRTTWFPYKQQFSWNFSVCCVFYAKLGYCSRVIL